MQFRQLYIFVEGSYDKRFFEKIIAPLFEKHFDYIKVVEYAQHKKETKKYLGTIDTMQANYLYVTDNDLTPCITERKRKEKRKIATLEEDKILVVVEEIESWYIAGIDKKSAEKMKVSLPDSTEKITKEKFRALKPKRFQTQLDFMLYLLNNYSIESAKKRNKSFKYFFEKYIEQGDQAWQTFAHS